jgi:dihydrofolate synthase/folylpolyglutamate synthase
MSVDPGAADRPSPAADRSAEALARLTGLHPKIIDLSLGRIERLLARLDHPERRLPPVIHVAGTNGKGSSVAFLRAILEAAGHRVHAYTSPHLVRFHERIRLGGTLIPEALLGDLLEECEAANDGAPITFFEITTAAAFLAFARQPADALLLEVGLGGRLDATNLVERPALSAITPVDYDHQGFLGDSLTAIAGEKAGILKPAVAAVIGRQSEEALDALRRRAARVGAPLLVHGQDWLAFEQHGRLVYQDEGGLMDLPLPRLAGRHQIDNAGLAIACLRALPQFGIGEQAVEAGLGAVRWPARLQRLRRGPLVAGLGPDAELWLDGGHNPAAGRALAQAMADMEERAPMPLHLVVGMLNTKDPHGFLAPFAGLARDVRTVTIPGEANALPAEVLAAAAQQAGLPAEPVADLDAALGPESRAATRVLICGSLYLAGKVLAENG